MKSPFPLLKSCVFSNPPPQKNPHEFILSTVSLYLVSLLKVVLITLTLKCILSLEQNMYTNFHSSTTVRWSLSQWYQPWDLNSKNELCCRDHIVWCCITKLIDVSKRHQDSQTEHSTEFSLFLLEYYTLYCWELLSVLPLKTIYLPTILSCYLEKCETTLIDSPHSLL